MPWSGGSFTSTNGVNTGATLWAQDRDDGTKILATRHDTNDQDMADGINSTLEKSGSNAATGNLNIGSNRLTAVADGTAKTDAATVNQIQSNAPAFQATDTGTANAHVIALSPAITAYAAGQTISFKAGAASTGASTLNVNTLGVKALKKLHDQDIAAGDIESGSIVTAVYDGTAFQVTSQLATNSATTADKLGTARTIASSGDVVWSVSFDGSTNVTAGATIQANSVDGTMIALGSDASGDIMYYSSDWVRLAKGSDDEVLTLKSGVPSWEASGGGGKIGQVLYTQKTDRTSITSTTTNAYADVAGLRQAITCSATSSKVLVSGYVTYHLVPSANGTIHWGLFRDTTQIGMGVDSGGTSRNPDTVVWRNIHDGGAWYTYGIVSSAFQFLDSPSSTSAITYSIKMSLGATYAGSVIVNGTDTVTGNSGYADYQPVSTSGVTLMEVLA